MFRRYDWECQECLGVREVVVEFPQGESPPRTLNMACPTCRDVNVHERMLSLPAEYHGERVLNPIVRGGQFDTAGQRPLPALPDLPPGVASTTSNYAQLFRTPEYREARRERAEVAKQNKAKQERLAKLRAGANINLRNDKLPGDPKVTA